MFWKHQNWTCDIDKFVQLVVASQLVTAEAMTQLRKIFNENERAKCRGANITDLSDFLVANGVLTFWQCHLLRNQQFKGFFIDGYKLLDFEQQKWDAGHYLAEEIATGCLVTLVVYPPKVKQGVNGRIAYDVVPRLHSR